MIPNETIEKIKDSVDIVDIISEYVELHEYGNVHQCLCPFLEHEDNKPSFSVSQEKQIFKCFGCGKAGSVFTFLMLYHSISFPKAVKMLGDKVGIKVHFEPKDELNESLYDLYDNYCNYYFNKDNSYYFSRKLNEKTIHDYLLGYCDGSALDSFVEKYQDSVLKESGLFYERNNKFAGEILEGHYIFPYFEHNGLVVGFGGKNPNPKGEEPPYRNVKENKIYHKSEFLYGIYNAIPHIRRMKCAVIVEGNFDVLQMAQNGFENTIGLCGSSLTTKHARLLKRFTKNVVLFFDGDKAGDNATITAIAKLFQEGFNVFVVNTPRGSDPDEICVKNALNSLMKKVVTFDVYLCFKEDKINDQINLVRDIIDEIQDIQQRRKFATVMAKILEIEVDIIYNDKILLRKPKKMKVESPSKEILLLAALMNDKEGFNDTFVKQYTFSDEIMNKIRYIIFENSELSSMYNNLNEEESELLSKVEFHSKSNIGVKYAVGVLKRDIIEQYISKTLKKIKELEKENKNTDDQMKILDKLLDEKEKL